MIKVLLLARDPEWYGGVVNYLNIITSRLGDTVKYDWFLIGKRKRGFGQYLGPLQVFVDFIRLLSRAGFTDYDVHHMNPSLNSRALVREGIFMVALKLLRKKNIMVFIRGWDDPFYDRLSSSMWAKKIFLSIYGDASLFVVLGESFRSKLIHLGVEPDKIVLTTTTFDGSPFTDPESSSNQVRMRSSDDSFNVILLSRFVREKGIYELIDAVTMLRDKGYKVRLILAGTGPEEDLIRKTILKNNAGDYIELPGYLRGVDKVNALLQADVFALPTYHGEGCPNALLEAMAAGLPVISTKVGGIPDIISMPTNGVLLDDVTPSSIADAVERYIIDENQLRQVSEGNRIHAWEKYEANVVANTLRSFYEKVMGDPVAVG